MVTTTTISHRAAEHGISGEVPVAGPAAGGLSASLVTTEGEFDQLGPAWEDLLGRADATIFQTFEWQRTWWKHFGRPCGLMILVFRRDGAIEGIAPLYRTRERLLGLPVTTRLQFIGAGISDYLAVIASHGNERAVAGALARWLAASQRTWDVFDLEDVQETSQTFAHLPAELEAAGLPVYRYHGTVCPQIPLPGSEDELMKQLGPASNYNLKRKLKKLRDVHKCETRLVSRPGDPIDDAMEAFARIHGGRWKSQGHPSAFDDPKHLAFHAEVCRKTAARGWLRMFFIDVGGEPVGVCFSFNFRSTIYMYQSNAHGAQEIMRCSPGLIVRFVAMTEGIREGMKTFDFMRGNEPYKYREWDAHDAKNWMLRSASRTTAGTARFWLYLWAELLGKAANRVRREYYDYRRYRLTGLDRDVPPPAYAMERIDFLARKTAGFASRHLPPWLRGERNTGSPPRP